MSLNSGVSKMTNLKTLKDIQEYCTDNDAVVDSLRVEAVKWIKQLNYDAGLSIKYGDESSTQMCVSQIRWIKHFFNIQESEIE